MPGSTKNAPTAVHWVLAAVPSIAFSFAILHFAPDVFRSPYSDADFNSSLVDTWEVYALASVYIGAGLILLALRTGIGAWRTQSHVRRLFAAVTVLGALALCTVMAAASSVTIAAERATGVSLSII